MLLVYFVVVSLYFYCAQSHQLDKSSRNIVFDMTFFHSILHNTINIITIKNLLLLVHLYERHSRLVSRDTVEVHTK